MAAEGKAIGSQGAVSFVVTLGESAPKQRRLPKGLAARRQQREAKASFTGQTIAEKQKRAEERRQKLKEERLERLHQLEEEMAGLARKIQAHEDSKNSEPSLPSPSPSSQESKRDTRCAESGLNNHTANGVIHHQN